MLFPVAANKCHLHINLCCLHPKTDSVRLKSTSVFFACVVLIYEAYIKLHTHTHTEGEGGRES